ncbi:hypothetical protein KIN20_001805 [Parelaphostrongylus tenuis]|uniref:Elongation of very long chain fatty acids protein n=1 Tax=Parelaphostrongylus tenuis TaxID=148309 RepID=A0AAD5MDB7_PARTN|nr:hypothetical protein KIN20_001805 [Parelaphostrongylus tenuis]
MSSSHGVWSGNGQTILYAPYIYESVGPEHLWNPLTVHAFFARHWTSSIYVALAYVVLINALQRVMESRKPLSMKTVLFLWNGTLAVFSFMGTWRFGIEFYHTLTTRPFTDSVCFSVDPNGPASFWACMFALSKVAELGDTVFLVIRKRPVIFLHWYHHAVVLIYCWHSGFFILLPWRFTFRWAIRLDRRVSFNCDVDVSSCRGYREKVFACLFCYTVFLFSIEIWNNCLILVNYAYSIRTTAQDFFLHQVLQL